MSLAAAFCREIAAGRPPVPQENRGISGKLHKEERGEGAEFIKTLYCIKTRDDIIYIHKSNTVRLREEPSDEQERD